LKRLVVLEYQIKPDSSWIKTIEQDLSWLYEFEIFSSILPDPGLSIDAWYTYIVNHSNSFKNLVKRAVKISIKSIVECNLPSYKAKCVLEPAAPLSFACDLCDKSFGTTKELACHRAGKHLVKQSLRRKIVSTNCYYCGKDYHTRYKIVSHIAYNSAPCRNYYTKCIADYPFEQVAELDAEESRHSSDLRSKGLRPGYHHIPPTSCLYVRPFNPGVDEVEG